MYADYYGDGWGLFGITHPSEQAGRSRALIICQPLLGEAVWTHWALKQIAQGAATAGYDVFRFDFSGTGNSPADIRTLAVEDWINDIEAAVDIMQQQGGHGRVSILAVRLAFAFAASVSLRRDVETLIGWDPVLDGSRWLEDRNADREEHPDGTTDIQGHALGPSFVSELEEVSVRSADAAETVAITTHDHTWDYPPEQMGIEEFRSTETWDWREPLPALFFAHDCIRQIRGHLP